MALWAGHMSVGDVFVVYWLENVAVWAFTFVHGVFAVVMAFIAGGDLHPVSWLWAGLALGLSHLGSLWINWYDGGERWRVSAGNAIWQPYPRMLVLGLKTVVDLALHLWERSRAGTGSAAVAG